MLTKEQKIEKLLHDLNEYARNADYEGLPCYDTLYDMVKMKAIVKAFVDSLEEDKPTDFDENQLNAYRAFLEAGIPDEWANAMADRVVDDGWEGADPTCKSHLCNFTRWDDTEEGLSFWRDVTLAVSANGRAAFSKFKCPK